RLVANLPIPSLFSRPRGLCVLIFAPSPLPLFYSALSPAFHLTLFSSSVLTASQIVIIFAALLGSDHVSYRFGKGIMPKAYPLRREARAVIIDGVCCLSGFVSNLVCFFSFSSVPWSRFDVREIDCHTVFLSILPALRFLSLSCPTPFSYAFPDLVYAFGLPLTFLSPFFSALIPAYH
ncbi:hypothetical protein B0H14DRAFT_3733445, partial [Mycena olivaceomarginata]